MTGYRDDRDIFCPLCEVRLDLHSGSGTCDTAARKADLLANLLGGFR